MTPKLNSQGPSSEVFLSPRVVDREAFDDFAGVLRAIVDDAHALGGSIESGAVSAKKTLDALERSESALRPKIDMAARVLRAHGAQLYIAGQDGPSPIFELRPEKNAAQRQIA